MNCVFCKIVRAEAPAIVLFRDDAVMAFLDIAPVCPGHALIIPLAHHTSLTTVSEATLARMMQLAPRLGRALMRELGVDGFNLHLANGACAGQVVPHSHLHVIPRAPTDGFSWGWRTTAPLSATTAQEIAAGVNKRLQPN